ncbi:hypothetical protein [Nostoc sp.]|uniref:hypothetical protein n=1 Tax=Nostoc sp. TaxID=1180 RepID=UPI002FF48514
MRRSQLVVLTYLVIIIIILLKNSLSLGFERSLFVAQAITHPATTFDQTLKQ